MANKPSFTLMDYRQRILDELHKLKGSIYSVHERYQEEDVSIITRKRKSPRRWKKNSFLPILRGTHWRRVHNLWEKKINFFDHLTTYRKNSCYLQKGWKIWKNAQGPKNDKSQWRTVTRNNAIAPVSLHEFRSVIFWKKGKIIEGSDAARAPILPPKEKTPIDQIS